MSEIQDPEKKPEKKNDRDFISEKIVRPAPSKKQIATKMATAACAGVIFGVVSAVCFVLTRPVLEQLSEGNRPTASAISIPKDEVESSAEAQETENAAETETEAVTVRGDDFVPLGGKYDLKVVATEKIQNATILLLAGLFFCAGIVLVHGVRTLSRLRLEEKERALRQEGEARQQMEDLANTDGLTGLYNERYFDALLKENELNRTPFVLFYLDLDRFKPVNDRYGHDVGDQLLKEVASRLRGCVRESDAVFRIGGDEFALIVNGAVTEGFCKSRVEKIKAAIREPYRLKDAEVQVGTSCGCAVYPSDSDDVRAIRILADHRMYEDKQRSGRSCE